MKKKILSILAAFAVMLSLSACQAEDTGQVSQASETVSSTMMTYETTAQNAAVTTTTDNSNDYPAYPLPDGWTFEKICGLFAIDGVPLSLEFTDKDFENINNNIKIIHDDSLFLYYYEIYYYDEFLLSYQKPFDDRITSFSFGYVKDNPKIIDSITFAGYPLTESEKIYDYLDEHFTVSYENESTKSRRYIFENGNSLLKLDIMRWSEMNPPILTMWFSIIEKEIYNNE